MTCNINRWFNIALLALTLFLAPSFARGDTVYWSQNDLLKEFFKTSERVTYVRVEKPEELKKILGYTPKKQSYVVFVARTKDRIDGYAVIDEEMGQHEPITFGVKISPLGQVERLEIMVYREGYGDEVCEKRFRRQFEGKTRQDDLRFGDDVVAITGATISSRAMTVGVRRAVAIVSLAEQNVIATAARN
jgi:Na+-translocating ferredoxin:NAD+ oxidoreductase subunit G